MSYADLADLQDYGGYDNPEEEALLESLLDAATVIIDRHCRRVFAVEADAERTFTADDVQDNELFLDKDLCAITSITVDGVDVTTECTTLPRNDPPYYILERDAGWGLETVVIGKWAYSLTPPADIFILCLRIASWLYKLRSASETVQAPTVVIGSVTVPAVLPKDILAILDDGYVRTTV